MEYTDEQTKTLFAFMQKLKGLGIVLDRAAKIKVEAGPIVTGYYFKLDNAIPINKIINKSEDFALAAGVDSVTIQRIKDEIVIFAANPVRKVIDFKDVLNYMMTAKDVLRATLPVPLGVDHNGNFAFVDLVECPHILLAGSTGSGKSVFEAAILATFCVRFNAKDLHIYTVDTKKMDLPLFSSLPHIKRSCENLMEYLEQMTQLLKEHENRALRIQAASVRNIREYNNMVGDTDTLPYILILIDEFADLIGQDKDVRRDKEHPANEYQKADFLLQRLAQVGRATGIHIIAATQRTSVKIISGDIKTNFPCRISLRLPTEADSRTILGTGGAENLLGKGDMLVQFADSEVLRRFHGPFVKHGDIVEVVSNASQIRSMYDMMRG